MPSYEYECEDGHEFERFRSMDKRHDVECPLCKQPVKLKISRTTFRIAHRFSVLEHDGTVISQTQTTEKTPPPGYRYNNPNLVEV